MLSIPDFLDGPLYPGDAAEALPGGAVLVSAGRPARRDLVEAGVEVVGVEDRQLVTRGHRRRRGGDGEEQGQPRPPRL